MRQSEQEDQKSVRRRRAPKRERVLGGGLIAVVILAPLAVGSAAPLAALVLALVGMAMWAAFAFAEGKSREGGRPATSRPLVMSPLAFLFWGLALIAALQLVPLPPVLFELFSPRGMALYEEGHRLLCGAQGSLPWRPLSLHAHGTADYGLHMVALGTMTALAAMLPSSYWRRLALAVCGAAALVTAVGVAQRLTGTQAVLWLYEPSKGLRTLSTFVSENHASAFVALGSLMAAALALEQFLGNKRHQAAAAAIVAALLFVVALVQPSFGTMLSYGMALALLVALALLRKGRAASRAPGVAAEAVSTKILMGLVVALILVAMSVPLAPLVVNALEVESAQARANLIRAALEASRSYGMFGAGLGSSAEVLLGWIDWRTTIPGRATSVENDVAEWTFTAGWAVALAALLAWGLTFWSALRLSLQDRHRSMTLVRLGLAPLVLYLVALSQIHFPLIALGLSLPLAMLIELGFASEVHRAGRENGGGVRWLLRLRGRRARGTLWLAALALTGWLGAWWVISPDTSDEQLLLAPPSDRPSPEALCEMVVRSPSSYTPFVLAAIDGERDSATRLALGEHAYWLAPLGRHRLLLAQLQMTAGHRGEALESFAALFDGHYLERPQEDWIAETLSATPEEQAARAEVLDDAPPDQWRRFFYLIEKREGSFAALDFVLELAARHDRQELDELMLLAMMRARQYPLLEVWAAQFLSQTRDPLRRVVAREALFLSLWHQGRRREAVAALRRWLVSASPETVARLARRALETLAPDPGGAPEGYGGTIESAQRLHCAGPLPLERRRRCWRAEAWLAEANADLRKAKKILTLLLRRADAPGPLLAFLVRQGQCHELQDLWRREGHRVEAHGALWKKAREQCKVL